jgi:glutaredoxin 3
VPTTPQITVYRTRTCPYCHAAEAFLKQKGLPFTSIDVSADAAKRNWLVGETGQTTVPQIFVGETSVGGYTDLRALDAAGGLDRLLAATSA